MDYQAFVTGQKTKIIAPAGYGKTTAIVECLKYTSGKQLILTHTHAGIASIKEKIVKNGAICSSDYNIETISSFAQKYVEAFYTGQDAPSQNDNKRFFRFIFEKAIGLFSLNPVINIVKNSYAGLFVDEYQDCTEPQHKMIMKLAAVLPAHILGDPMQGIFGFNERLISFSHDLNDFEEFPELKQPWRWTNSGNTALGEDLADIRARLIKNLDIDLTSYRALSVQAVEDNIYNNETNQEYIRKIKEHIRKDNVLIMAPKCPGFDSINKREKLKLRFGAGACLQLLEAIDEKTYYEHAKQIDDMFIASDKYKKLKEYLVKLFNKNAAQQWLGTTGVINKRAYEDKIKSKELRSLIDIFNDDSSALNLLNILKKLNSFQGFNCWRDELLRAIFSSLKKACIDQISVFEAMKQTRNIVRRTGRKIKGKCIGTTLLTKGLEFDKVIILDAHKYTCPKNFYVAITRCCKELIIFTKETTLTFPTV